MSWVGDAVHRHDAPEGDGLQRSRAGLGQRLVTGSPARNVGGQLLDRRAPRRRGHARAELDGHSRDRLTLTSELRRATERSELVVHYQLKHDLATGVVTGMEALLRWVHPTRGLLLQGDFSPLAEHSDLIRPLTRTVLDLALRDCRRWNDAGHRIGVAVNLSVRQPAARRPRAHRRKRPRPSLQRPRAADPGADGDDHRRGCRRGRGEYQLRQRPLLRGGPGPSALAGRPAVGFDRLDASYRTDGTTMEGALTPAGAASGRASAADPRGSAASRWDTEDGHVDIATQEDIGIDHPASVAQRRVLLERPDEHVDAIAVLAGDELGRELHTTADETLVVVTGRGTVELDGASLPVRPGSVVFIPRGTSHNIRNEGATPLRLFALHASSS